MFAARALEGLQVVGEEKDILKEIRRGMETEDQEEVVIKPVKELKKSPAKSVKSSEWSLETVCYIIKARSMSPNPTFAGGS